jgi:hypothetical protein
VDFVLILSFSLGLGVFAFIGADFSVTTFFLAVTILTPPNHHSFFPTAIIDWQVREQAYHFGLSMGYFAAT